MLKFNPQKWLKIESKHCVTEEIIKSKIGNFTIKILGNTLTGTGTNNTLTLYPYRDFCHVEKHILGPHIPYLIYTECRPPAIRSTAIHN